MAGERYMTRDHERIRRWVEERDGTPSTVKSTHEADDAGLIRIDFPGYSGGDSLEPISWDEWFRKFDDSDLVLLYQETLASGARSNFNELISRSTADGNDSAEWADGSDRRGRRGGSSRRGDGDDRGGSTRRVDLNRANAEDLDAVFGIGRATAEKIIRYRDEELGGTFPSAHAGGHIPLARNSS